MKKILYITIESKSRELYPKLFLVNSAIRKNFDCFVGDKVAISRAVKILGPGIYFYKSIKKDENHDESWFALALILDLQGQHLEASYHIKKALDIDPNCVDYLFSYAQINEKVGFIKEAEMAYQKVLDLDEFAVNKI